MIIVKDGFTLTVNGLPDCEGCSRCSILIFCKAGTKVPDVSLNAGVVAKVSDAWITTQGENCDMTEVAVILNIRPLERDKPSIIQRLNDVLDIISQQIEAGKSL
mgnify:CR=1 FL=1